MQKHTRLIWAFILSSIIFIGSLFPVIFFVIVLSVWPLLIIIVGLALIFDSLALLEAIRNKDKKSILISLIPVIMLVISWVLITHPLFPFNLPYGLG